MKKCSICGKRGLFLRVNSYGRCKACEDEFQKEEQERFRQIEKQKAFEKRVEQIKSICPPLLKDFYCPKYIYQGVDIAGYRYYVKKNSNVAIGDSIDFEMEPNNQHDNEAIAISCRERKIGHVHYSTIKDMINDYMFKDAPIRGFIDALSKDTASYTVVFYRKVTGLSALSVIRLEHDEQILENYETIRPIEKNKLLQLVNLGNMYSVYCDGKVIGVINGERKKEVDAIQENNVIYPLFFGERMDKKGKVIISIKIYYQNSDELERLIPRV